MSKMGSVNTWTRTQQASSSSSSCCISEQLSKLFGFESRTATLSLFVAVNLGYFLVFALGKSVVSLCCYLLTAPLIFGLFLKVLNLAPSDHHKDDNNRLVGGGPLEFVSKSRIAAIVDSAYDSVNEWLEATRAVCLWRDVLFSAKVCSILFGIGYVSSFCSLPCFVFLVSWGLFVYTFCASILQDTVCPIVAPYVKMANQAIHSLIQAIPTMEDESRGKKKL